MYGLFSKQMCTEKVPVLGEKLNFIFVNVNLRKIFVESHFFFLKDR